MTEKIRLALVTDIHNGPDLTTKKGESAPALLEEIIAQVNRNRPDAMLDLGDRVSDVAPDDDRARLRELAERFSAVEVPRFHLIGNHDVVHLHREENAEFLECSMASRVIDLDSVRLVLWQAAAKIERGTGFPVLTEDLDWLVETLEAEAKPAIVFSHVPVSAHSQLGNYYFENNFHHSTYPNHREIQRRVEASGRVVLWVSGHVHWNTVTVLDGLPHLTVQSLTESFTTASHPAGSWAELSVDEEAIDFRVHGRDPFQVRLARPDMRSGRWKAPLAPFGSTKAAE